jgi:succinate dehydrogenase / fumarate reductase cytochrome b subunit
MSNTLPSAVVKKYTGIFSGMLAHVIQRLTGLALLFYLFMHVHTIRELSRGPEAFNHALAQFANPLFRMLEIGLLATVILHALNGIRLTMIDLGVGHGKQRQLWWAWSVGVGAVIFLAGAIPIFLASVLKVM